jgi:tetratricopeptide (TPR) repeat protein
MGDTREAMPRIIKALDMTGEIGELYSKANYTCNLARGFRLDGDLGRAEAAYTEAYCIMEEIESIQEPLAESLTGLATIAIDRGHLSEAKEKLQKAMDVAAKFNQSEEMVRALTQFGRLASAGGDPERAAIFLIQVDVQNRNTFTTWGPEVKEGQDLLGQIEKEMEVEAFGKVKERAEAMSLEEVVKLARGMVVVKPEKQEE